MSSPKSPVPERSKVIGLVLVACFVAMCWAPLLATFVNLSRGPGNARQEAMARTPAFPDGLKSALRWPGAFKWYFQKRFGLREELIRLHALVKVHGLGMTSNRDVLLGKNHWLFLASERVLDYDRNSDPFSSKELARWTSELDARRQWVEAHGARYLVVIAPNKHTTYPDLLPEHLAPHATTTRLDQLLKACEGRVDVLDLRPALESGRKRGRVFHVTDTHWNLLGGWFGSRAILDHLGPGPWANVLGRDPGPPREVSVPGGDLARMLGLREDWTEADVQPSVVPGPLVDDAGRAVQWTHVDVRTEDVVVARSKQRTGKVVVLRDSFGEALIPWLSQCFARTVWIATYGMDRARIEREHPDLVIQQLVERKLMTIEPSAEPGGLLKL